MKRILFLMSLLVMMNALAFPAHATLIPESIGGVQVVYDSSLDITWLQDANYAKTSGFAPGGGGALPGQMNWYDAAAWASGSTFGGISGWRLPNEDLVVDGYQGEMAYLYYAELGNLPGGAFNSGPFMNIQHGVLGANDEYWYATALSPTPPFDAFAWQFSFTSGLNGQDDKGEQFVFAWAVHDGDIAAVPEPNTLLLLGSGLIGMVAFRKKFKKQVDI